MDAETTFKGWKVFVVEDELFIALELCDHLKALGCEIVGPEPSVKKAMAALETKFPDVAFLDENLGGEHVTPIAQSLQRRRIPFAIVSGYNKSPTGEPVLEQALRVAKPASADAIVAALGKLRPIRLS